jgi:hypothetical protein
MIHKVAEKKIVGLQWVLHVGAIVVYQGSVIRNMYISLEKRIVRVLRKTL